MKIVLKIKLTVFSNDAQNFKRDSLKINSNTFDIITR